VLDDDVAICKKPGALSDDQAKNIISRMM